MAEAGSKSPPRSWLSRRWRIAGLIAFAVLGYLAASYAPTVDERDAAKVAMAAILLEATAFLVIASGIRLIEGPDRTASDYGVSRPPPAGSAAAALVVVSAFTGAIARDGPGFWRWWADQVWSIDPFSLDWWRASGPFLAVAGGALAFLITLHLLWERFDAWSRHRRAAERKPPLSLDQSR
jgi:hypothetical protein